MIPVVTTMICTKCMKHAFGMTTRLQFVCYFEQFLNEAIYNTGIIVLEIISNETIS